MEDTEGTTNANIARQGFGSDELQVQHETAATAVAARVQAEVQARYIMALKRPRHLDVVRQRVLKECDRPGFAKAARYFKPVGKGIEGPSIRFAEAAIRYMGNLDVQSYVVYDDPKKAIHRVTVTDLEANVPYSLDVVVQKTVERRRCPTGQRPLGERINSEGERVYLLPALDEDVLNKTNALISKAIRTLGLRHLPGDILDEAMDKCIEVARKRDAEDPDAARKELLDAFWGIGVQADQIALYLGHDPQILDPAELLELRAVYQTIKQGEATWRAVFEHKTGVFPDAQDDKEAAKRHKGVDDLIARQKAKQQEKQKAKQAPARERQPGEDDE